MGVAVLFGYDGLLFKGFAVQNIPHPPITVMGEIHRSLRKLALSNGCDPAVHRVSVASRTDRGVSALGNVLHIRDSPLEPKKMLDALNAQIPGCVFRAYTMMDDDFNPRYALFREYIYSDPTRLDGEHFDIYRANMERFLGEHDFVHYCKKDPSLHASHDTTRLIDKVEVVQKGPYIVTRIRARSFLWQMVRRIIGHAMQSALSGRCLPTDAVVRGPHGTMVAPPDYLVLSRVSYGEDIFAGSTHTISYSKKEALRTRMNEFAWHRTLTDAVLKGTL